MHNVNSTFLDHLIKLLLINLSGIPKRNYNLTVTFLVTSICYRKNQVDYSNPATILRVHFAIKYFKKQITNGEGRYFKYSGQSGSLKIYVPDVE